MLDFFHGLGLVTVKEDEGRVYPGCGQAAAVLEVLRGENGADALNHNPVMLIKVKRIVEDAQIIDAIPAEWLKERKHWAAIDGDHWAENIINWLLEAWQKEQEARWWRYVICRSASG